MTKKEKIIDHTHLYPGEAIRCIYGLPKKEGAPLGPLISSIYSVTYKIAEFLASRTCSSSGRKDLTPPSLRTAGPLPDDRLFHGGFNE